MGSKLLTAQGAERGFAGVVNRRFDRVRALYTRVLSSTLAYRPVVFVLWAIVVGLIFPFYMFSQKELAPNEDQGSVFAIIQSAANSTLDQVKLFGDKLGKVFGSFPESSMTFQITSPEGGFDSWAEASIWSCDELLLRSFHGLVTMPPKPPSGLVI